VVDKNFLLCLTLYRMKRRTTSRRKTVRIKSSRRRHSSHLRVHRIFIISNIGIFGLTLLFAAVQTVFHPIALQNASSSEVNVLGDEVNREEDEINQAIDKLSEEQKRTEKEIAELNGDKLYEKVLVKPTLSPDRIEVKTKIERRKEEMELQTADGKKIKARIEDDGTKKIEIEHRRLKFKYEVLNGNVIKRAEDEEGKNIDLDAKELDVLEQEVADDLEGSGIKIETGDTGKISFAKNNIAATTNFPLAIDLGTNQLVVTTPAGQKIVAVLPDDAVQNMLATGVINALDDTPIGTDAGVVEFTVENDEPVYKIAGLKKFKMLGFIPVTQPITAIVSSETGKEIKTEKPFFTTLVDLLSP
jgi:hypothetical protein